TAGGHEHCPGQRAQPPDHDGRGKEGVADPLPRGGDPGRERGSAALTEGEGVAPAAPSPTGTPTPRLHSTPWPPSTPGRPAPARFRPPPVDAPGWSSRASVWPVWGRLRPWHGGPMPPIDGNWKRTSDSAH